MPKRVQLLPRQGWIDPLNTIIVTRPTRWGNPFETLGTADTGITIQQFTDYLAANPDLVARAKRELMGKDLACWCPLDRPCHADVWLKLVNSENQLAP